MYCRNNILLHGNSRARPIKNDLNIRITQNVLRKMRELIKLINLGVRDMKYGLSRTNVFGRYFIFFGIISFYIVFCHTTKITSNTQSRVLPLMNSNLGHM